MVDGLVFANDETNDDWDGIWIVRTARTDEGWSWVQDLERGYDFRRQESRLATKLQYTFRF